MKVFTLAETRAINDLAAELGIPPLWLVALIDCESGWDPQLGNMTMKGSTKVLRWKPGTIVPPGYKVFAVGLNQIIPSTAASLGYPGGEALVAAYPTVLSQLQGPSRSYLKKNAPYTSLQDLALSNFAPKYRKIPDTPLSGDAAIWNKGFRTYGDYAKVVEARAAKLSPRWKVQDTVATHPVASSAGLVVVVGLTAYAAWKWL